MPRMRVVFKAESTDSYLARYFDYYETLKFANVNVPASAKILLIWAHGYYCERESVKGDYVQGLIPYDLLSAPKDIISRLKALKIDYIIISNNYRGTPYKEHILPLETIDKIKKPYLTLVYSKDNVDLYKVN
jgi:hypothetical protein